MSRTFKAMILASAMAFGASSTAHAGLFDFDPAKGNVYISGFGGVAIPFDSDFDGDQNPAAGVGGVAGAAANVEAEFSSDVYFGGAIGARLPFKYWKYFQPRLELEISRYEADVNGGSFNGGDQIFSGEQSATFFLINNSSEFVWRDDQRIVPYFGGGIGLADFDTNIQYFPNNGVATAPVFGVQGSDTGFATLSTLGANFKATPQVDIYVEGRYLKTYGIDADRVALPGGGFNASLDDDPDGLTFTGGIRFNF